MLAAKLTAVVAGHTGDAPTRPGTYPPGAALREAERAWVLLDETVDDGTGLGPAIAWALRGGSVALNVVADAPLTVVARRAAEFTMPIQVWALSGRELQPVPAGAIAGPPSASEAHLALAADIEAAGADVVVEHGVVTGEVRGLEVCRVVDVDGGGVRLEVGVGRHDREAFAIIHGDVPKGAALAGVVAAVDGGALCPCAGASAESVGAGTAVAVEDRTGAEARGDGVCAFSRTAGAAPQPEPSVALRRYRATG